MKKLLLTLTTLAISSLSADILRIEGGAGAWTQDAIGSFEEKITNSKPIDFQDTLGYNANTNYYVWAYIKHPIPIIPNARLEATNSEFSGSTKTSFSWNGNDYNAGVSNSLSLKQYDAILYYNILDNLMWITLDLGLDAKFINTSTSILGDEIDNSDFALALLYGRGRVEVPGTGLGFEVDIKGLDYSSVFVYDMRAKIDYKFDFALLQPGIELGYRYETINISSDDIVPVSAKMDITISGIYAGLTLTF